MTLTKDQRYYRKQQKKSKKDFGRATSCSGYPAIHANKKKLCARVSESSYNYLKTRAEAEGKTMTALLEKLILCIMTRPYGMNSSREPGFIKYYWGTSEGMSLKRKRGGTKQLNVWVVSTAWHKVDEQAKRIGYSKSRCIEMMLRDRPPLSTRKDKL